MIAFDVTPELRHKIKILATRRNVSMNLWIMRALNDRIDKETKYDNDSMVEKDLQLKQEFENAKLWILGAIEDRLEKERKKA